MPVPPRPVRRAASDAPLLAAVLVGGAAGGLARHAVTEHWTSTSPQAPSAVFGVNTVGAFLIGVLLVVLGRRFTGHRLARPLLATGLLGGFTTFSTVVTDADRMLAAGRAGPAGGFLLLSVAAGLAAVVLGTV